MIRVPKRSKEMARVSNVPSLRQGIELGICTECYCIIGGEDPQLPQKHCPLEYKWKELSRSTAILIPIRLLVRAKPSLMFRRFRNHRTRLLRVLPARKVQPSGARTH